MGVMAQPGKIYSVEDDGLIWEMMGSSREDSLGWRRRIQLGNLGSAGEPRLSCRRYTQMGNLWCLDCCMFEKFALGWGNNSVGEIDPVEEVNFL